MTNYFKFLVAGVIALFSLSTALVTVSAATTTGASKTQDHMMETGMGEGDEMVDKMEKMEKEMDEQMEKMDGAMEKLENESSEKGEKGMMMSEMHKSDIAKIVAELKALSDKDAKIGAELKAIAKEQEDGHEQVEKAMKSLEERGKFKTLLFGTDYKSVGSIRSELVKSENHIDRLTKSLEKVTDPVVKADLEKQIEALKKAHGDALAFVDAKEDSFSLLGWLVKLLQ